MIFDSVYGLPRDNGATDYEDSARLAGLMCVFMYPGYERLRIQAYKRDERYVRHASGSALTFSRDQAVCLFGGYWRRNMPAYVRRELVDGIDVFSPSVVGYTKRCQGLDASWFEDVWLWLDIVTMRRGQETNQMLCMVMVAGPVWVKRYCRFNPQWREEIRAYWCGWRNESALAEWMIECIESVIA